jgi:hypothetical protein
MEARLVDDMFTIDILDFALNGVGPGVDRIRISTESAPFVAE